MILANRLGWIGVDIGTRTIKLAQVARTPSGLRLRHAAVIQRAHSWTDDDSLALAAPNSSEAEIRAALQCAQFRGRSAACTLPMNVCELRGLNIPHGEDHERRSMIANELADDWAGLPQPMQFDFWPLEVDRKTNAADAFNVDVLSVAKPWIMQAANDCQRAKLDCWAVDGSPLAMARAVGMTHRGQSGQRVLTVDWGFSNTTICAVGNGAPLFARRIHQGSFRTVLEAIRSALGMTLDQAQHVAAVHGVAASNDEEDSENEIHAAVTTALAEPAAELTGEIQRTLRFFDLQRRHLRPSSVLLMGGGGSVKNIGPYLSKLLDLPVDVWHVPWDTADTNGSPSRSTALLGCAVALSALAWGDG